MMQWLLHKLNIGDEMAQHLNEVSFAWHHERLFWAGLIVLIPLSVFIYLRQKWNLPSVPPVLRCTLTATRVLILLLLVVVLGGPYLTLKHSHLQKPIVAFLFDHSQSMQLPLGDLGTKGKTPSSGDELANMARAAGYNLQQNNTLAPETRRALPRMSRAKHIHAVVQATGRPLTEKLAQQFDVRYYSFAGKASRLGLDPSHPQLPEPPNPGGSSTRIGDAIAQVYEEAAGRPVAGIVVFSDGRNTGGSSLGAAEQLAGEAGTPICTVPPAGSRDALQDVAIADLFTTALVSKGDTAQVAVTIRSQGFDGRTVPVQLKDGDKLLDSKDLVLSSTEVQQIELTFQANEVGAHYLTVHIPPQREERPELRANNTDTAFVRVTDEKIKVLYVEGWPRWDFRFLKNAMNRDHGLSGSGPATPSGSPPPVAIRLEAEWRRQPPVAQKTALPATLDELADYHVVILGDVSPKMLDDRKGGRASFLDLLSEAVQKRGVGLIVQAGPRAMPHAYDARLLDLLPVRLKSKQAGLHPGGKGSFRLELTAEGALHEATRFYDEPGRNQNAWDSLPRYFWCSAAERPAPAATVLVRNPIKGPYGKMPIIAHHYAGRGKVLFVGTDETFRWRRNVGDRFFYKFWGQSLRFVARRDKKDGKKSWIEVRPVRTQPGEEAEVEVMAFGPDGAPLTDASVQVQVQGGGKPGSITLAADPAVKGRYVGKLTPAKEGEYRISYVPPGQKEPIEVRLRAARSPEEMRNPGIDETALRELATSTGGRMVELPELATLADQFHGTPQVSNRPPDVASLWDNGLFLAVLIFLYTLDVGLRRLMGLS